MEIIVLFSALLIGYALLRSRGGQGLDIKFELGPASTSKGKTNRLMLGLALAVWSSGLIFVLFRQQGGRTSTMISVIVGAVIGLLFLVPYLKKRK